MRCHTAVKKVRLRRPCQLAIVPMSPSLPTDGGTLQMVGRRQQQSPLGLPLGPEGSAALARFPGGPSTALPSGALRLPSRPLDAAATSHRWSMTPRELQHEHRSAQPCATCYSVHHRQCLQNAAPAGCCRLPLFAASLCRVQDGRARQLSLLQGRPAGLP